MDLKRKALSLVLAMAMMITFMPALAFANDDTEENQEPLLVEEEQEEEVEAAADVVEEQAAEDASEEEVTEEAKEEVTEEAVEEASEPEAAEETPVKEEAAEEPETDSVMKALAVGDAESVQLAQTKLDYRGVTVTVPDLDTILAEGTADSVKIVASMSYNKNVTQKEEFTLKLAEFDASAKTAEFETAYFGKYDVTASFLKDGKQVGDSVKSTLGVAAEEYNIAGFVATTDPLMFSLKYFIDGAVKKTTDAGDPVPTIVTLNRAAQFDWDKLPEGMYRTPLLTDEEAKSKTLKWDEVQGPDNKVDRMVQYVKELNEIHPGSKFNFFINDYHTYSFPRLSYANGLEDDQYTLTLITDGSATYVWFKTAYEGVEDAQAVHDRLVSEYNQYKEDAKAGKITDYSQFPSGDHKIYSYAMVDAENANWWVVRKSGDTFGLTDTTFQAKVTGDSRITSNYINNLLKSVQDNGRDELFKALYKFDDEAFNATRAKGKKIMMILGTSKSLEDQYPVTDYVRFMIAEMGDEYEFYYKGHPGNYTANSDDNVAKYAAMGIQMLDPSIAAELFLFYNDDLYLCGYESSLYTNASSEKSEEQDIALFRRTLQTAKADPNLTAYADYMDFFISDMTNDTDIFTYAYDEAWDAARPGIADAKAEAIVIRDKVKALVPAAEANDGNYLVQYNNNGVKTVSEYDYAIWNSDKAIIHYIKTDENGDLYIAKTVDTGGPAVGDKVKVEGNTYQITSMKNRVVSFVKAKNAKSVSVPKTVKINGEKYTVTTVGASAFTGSKIRTVTVGANVKTIKKNAFKGSAATLIVLKTQLLTKKSVAGSLKSSKVAKVKVKVGTDDENEKFTSKYKKYFTKANAGRKVTVYFTYAASKKIHLRKTTISLAKKKTYQQKLIDKSGKVISASKIKWKSSKTSVAKISKKGKITALKKGTAKMTAKYKGKTYKFTVKVK